MPPTFRPSMAPSIACAASSMTIKPCRRASSIIALMSQIRPARCTGMIARVRGVIACSIASNSIDCVRHAQVLAKRLLELLDLRTGADPAAVHRVDHLGPLGGAEPGRAKRDVG